MADELMRRPDETELQYHRRLVYGKLVDKTLSDYDYAELAPYVYGKEYSTDVARRLLYGSRYTLDLMDEQAVASVTDDDVRSEIDTKLVALQKERAKLQTEKLEYSRWLREDARDELFMEQVLAAVREHIGEQTVIEDIPLVHNDREGVLCIADCHFGKVYKIYGVFNEVLNEYSPEIFYDRMERLYNEALEVVGREGLSVLRVFNLGDSVDGFLRHSQLWTLRYGVVDSAILFGNYMGRWLRRLSEHVNVIYAQTDGNHDELRLLDGRKGQHLNESSGKIILNCIALINADNPNFTLLENLTGFIYDTVAGYEVLGIHGEVKDMARAIQEYQNVYHIDLSYVIGGHMHNANYKNCGVRRGAIGVGSIVGADDFSVKIRRMADATASTLIFEAGKGKVAEYTHVLN